MVVNFEPSAKITEASVVQPLNAIFPIVVTLAGMVIEDRDLHFLNTYSSMVANFGPSAKMTEVSPVQPEHLQLIVYQLVLIKTVEKCRL